MCFLHEKFRKVCISMSLGKNMMQTVLSAKNLKAKGMVVSKLQNFCWPAIGVRGRRFNYGIKFHLGGAG